MASSRISIAIVGGGITGAAFTNFLRQSDKFDITIYESAKEFSEIGAGIGLWGQVMELFKDIDLYDACERIVVEPRHGDPDFAFKLQISDRNSKVDIGDWSFKGGSRFSSRSKLLDILVAKIPQGIVQYNKRLKSYQQCNEGNCSYVELFFSDGSTGRCDLLIGTDGIHSIIRKQMYQDAIRGKDPILGANVNLEEYTEPIWTGGVACRALVPVEELKRVSPDHPVFKESQLYLGQEKHLVAFRVNAKQINIATAITDFSKEGTRYPHARWVREIGREQIVKAFEDFEEDALSLIRLMPNPTLWAIHTLNQRLPFFARGNVVLLGDAAHAMAPYLGLGGGVGIQDAWALAAFLASPHISTVSELSFALSAYNTARVSRTAEIAQRALEQGYVYQLRMTSVGRDPKLLKAWVERNTKEILEMRVQDDVQVGLQWIEQEKGRKRA